ncbi:T9SS type A sorting domain-containing protein [Flavobacterium psychrotolerans]|nr:T9SS type A sorting domain-containing protein [Flavobacterium psychrotolerans]
MKKLYTLLLVAVAFTANAQTTISQWNFDDADPAKAQLPTTGSGTFSLVGGVEDNLTAGLMPAGNPSTGKAYSVKTFPLAATASGTAGFQFAVSTANFSGISVSFDPRSSNTASKWQQYQYTVDGTNWIVLGNNAGALVNAFPTAPISITLPASADNNAKLAIRLVSIFDPAGSDYVAVGATSTYSAGGTWRIDNVTFTGTSLGVKQNSISGLSVYPNPVTNGNLFITSNSNEVKSVAIFDVLGKQVVKTTTASNQAINVSNLNNGVYILKITEEGKTATRKLVIK